MGQTIHYSLWRYFRVYCPVLVIWSVSFWLFHCFLFLVFFPVFFISGVRRSVSSSQLLDLSSLLQSKCYSCPHFSCHYHCRRIQFSFSFTIPLPCSTSTTAPTFPTHAAKKSFTKSTILAPTPGALMVSYPGCASIARRHSSSLVSLLLV